VRKGILVLLSKADAKGPEGFVQCPACKKIVFNADYEAALRVCPYCNHHGRLPARLRITTTFDPLSFVEQDAELRSRDTLEFPEYGVKLAISTEKADSTDSMISGMASLEGERVAVAAADFTFMGGSMGSVAGEKVTRTLERAVEEKVPAIVFCASGGARMQEGILSLMQMAKTVAAAERARRRGVPFITVFTDPTMAGVLASYASIADVIVAEPKALVGFAGARVSAQAGVGKVPNDFQSAEWVHSHGMVDRIVPRKEMRSTLSTLVRTLGGHLAR
jgi:acetyl-CoA carboxylase carboxyl transferase subunit beta